MPDLEKAATDAMTVALRRFTQQLKAKLKAAGSVSEIEPALVRALWADQVPGLLSVVKGGWDAGTATTAAKLGAGVVEQPLLAEQVLQAAQNRMVNFTDDLWLVVRGQLAEGVASGESIGQLAARLGDLPGLAESRATVVARTEVISASNLASQATAAGSGLVLTKRWLDAGDDRVRDGHHADEVEDVPVDEPFTVNGEALMYPGDPAGSVGNVANCRCVSVYDTGTGFPTASQDEDAEALVAAAAQEDQPMPWTIVEGGGDCADSEFAVVKDSDGSTAGCHDTRDEAEAQLAALYASEGDGEVTLAAEGDSTEVEHFHAVAIVDGVETKEIPRRLFQDTTWRELPLPLMWQRDDSHGGEPPPTMQVGKITRAERHGQETHVWGVLDLEGDDGAEFARRLVAGFVKGVSVDAGDLVADDIELLWPDDTPESEEDLFMMAEPETVVLHGASLLGLTAVAFPAWDGPFVAALPALVEALEQRGLEVESVNVEDPSLAASVEQGRCHECGGVLALAGRNGSGLRGDQRKQIEPGSASGDLRGHGRADPTGANNRSPVSTTALLQPSSHGASHDTGEPTPSTDVVGSEGRAADAVRQGTPLRRGEHGDEEAGGSDRSSLSDLHPRGQPQAVLRPPGTLAGTQPGVRTTSTTGRQTEVILAASHIIELTDRPPAWWFDEPVDQPVLGALTVTDEGRLFGWLAPDNVGHISPLFSGRTVPLGADYSRFYRGQPVRCADGTERMAGNVTMGCNHAPRQASVPEIEQFENTCAVFGRTAIGERKGTGVWVAGYVLPSVTADQVERAMACQLSGYWRPKERGSGVELFSALLVPVPGFPMARRSLRQSATMVASSVPVQFALAEEPDCQPRRPTLRELAAVHEFAASEASRRVDRAAAYAASVNERGA